MSKSIFFLILFFLKIFLTVQICEEGKNFCVKCDYRTKQCAKCEKDLLIPDDNGGCEGAKNCMIGKNYCLDCENDGHLCKICEEGYVPDENGGCSITNFCEISEKGKCIKCKENFILIGDKNENENIIWCKSLNSEDFKNCDKFDQKKGFCEKCKENYYLNKGDHKCINIENCFESSFGICQKCIDRYYYNKLENKCKMQTDMFYKCQLSTNNETCDICDQNYYLAENGKCSEVNFCLNSVDYARCEKCLSGYYLIGSKYNSNCTIAQNCKFSDKDTGLCLECIEGYYLDYKDGKCKSNKNNDEFKNCKISDEICKECINGYYLAEDSKCSNTKGCLEVEDGICLSCIDNYYYGLDHKCCLIEHCIYSLNENECSECEDNYCYNTRTKNCFLAENNLKNCKIANVIGEQCFICKGDFYLNQTNNLCYSNKEKGNFYKCEITNYNAEKCHRCINGYYLGYKYNRCSSIQGCEYSEDDKACNECNENYCIDISTGKCEKNNFVQYEDKIFYYKCNKTNEEGNACEQCIEGLSLNENGLCVDKINCKKEEDGKCLECPSNDEDRVFHYHCLNDVFGCVETFLENCLECNNILDFNKCTKCVEGYELNNLTNKCDKLN